MNSQEHGQPYQVGTVTGTTQTQGDTNLYQPNLMPVPRFSRPRRAPIPLGYEEILHQQRLQLQQKLRTFWANQHKDAERATEFRRHRLPLSRIKKIMKADKDVKMISSETPTMISKASEMFILELTLRSWCHAEANRRKTLQKNDVLSAINGTEIFDFLADIENRENLEDQLQAPNPTEPAPVMDPSESFLLYDIPPPELEVGNVQQSPTTIPDHVVELSELLYHASSPMSAPQVGTSGLVIGKSPMETIPDMGPSAFPNYQHAPQVCDIGTILGKTTVDRPIHVQPSLGAMGVMGPSGFDHYKQHQFSSEVGGTSSGMAIGKSVMGQPIYSAQSESDLVRIWQREEQEELESTWIERSATWL